MHYVNNTELSSHEETGFELALVRVPGEAEEQLRAIQISRSISDGVGGATPRRAVPTNLC